MYPSGRYNNISTTMISRYDLEENFEEALFK